MNREELEEKIDELQDHIAGLNDEIRDYESDIDNFDVAEHLSESVIDDMLNDDGPVTIADVEFDRAYILQELDPTAYREAFINYCDGVDPSTIPEYVELIDDRDDLNDDLDDAEADLESYQDELDALEDEEDEDE